MTHIKYEFKIKQTLQKYFIKSILQCPTIKTKTNYQKEIDEWIEIVISTLIYAKQKAIVVIDLL